MELPECQWRRTTIGPERHHCAAPYARRPRLVVSSEECSLCKCPDCDEEQGRLVFKSAPKAILEVEKEAPLTKEQYQSFMEWLGDTTKLGRKMVMAYRKWYAAGRPRPTTDELAERKATCEACPHLRGKEGERRCGLCGCPIGAVTFLFGLGKRPGKAEMSTETCPDSPPRWKPLTVIPG